jgi:hypothetical protein
MKSLLSFTSILLACAGCALTESEKSTSANVKNPYPCHGSFRIEGLEEHEIVAIEAAKRWNDFIGYEHFTISNDGKCPIQVGSDANMPESPPGYTTQGYYGVNDDGETCVVVNSKIWITSTEHQIGVLMHEFGHSEKLIHVEGQGPAVMSVESHSDTLTDVDRAECERVGFCKKGQAR